MPNEFDDIKRLPDIPYQLWDHECRSMVSHVYVIQSGEYLKIGIARDVMRRLEQIRANNPHETEVALCREVPRFFAQQAERRAHQELIGYRHRGEWFAVCLAIAQPVVDEACEAAHEAHREALGILERVHHNHMVYAPYVQQMRARAGLPPLKSVEAFTTFHRVPGRFLTPSHGQGART